MRIALPPVIDPAAFAYPPGWPVIDIAGETMGTRWSVRCATTSRVDAAVLHDAVVARLDDLVAQMSHWQPASDLCRFNAAAAGSWEELPSDFADVMKAALELAVLTNGAFDPAIGHVVDLHGFGPIPIERPPTEAEIAAARSVSRWRRLQIDGNRLRQPGGLSLDLSGIAKGYAVDAIADLLAGRGIRHCLVEIGGELAGRGIRPDGEPWWVDLEAPPGLSLPPLRVALHDLAVATSGDYVRGRHTIDPRTGRSTDNGVVSVSVIHPSAMLADAWATALTVLGDSGRDLADRHDIAARIVTGRDDRTGEWLSATLRALLDG